MACVKLFAQILLILVLSACSATPEEISRDRRSRPNLDLDPAIVQQQFQIDDFTLHYAEIPKADMPIIVFIHGTPGSWRSLGRMMTRPELRDAAHLVSIDRPGWGNSLIEGQRSEPDFMSQSQLIAPLLKHLKAGSPDQPLILVGHSYGGSISPYLAFRYPELVDGVLMAASAIDPVLGKPRWYNYAASVWPVSRLIDERLQIANDEIWGVAPALQQLDSWWETTNIPLIYVQGEEDELVHPDNLDFAEQRMTKDNHKVVRLAEQGHLLHIQQRDLLSELTLELITTSLDEKLSVDDNLAIFDNENNTESCINTETC